MNFPVTAKEMVRFTQIYSDLVRCGRHSSGVGDEGAEVGMKGYIPLGVKHP